jgi:hypothetical protein
VRTPEHNEYARVQPHKLPNTLRAPRIRLLHPLPIAAVLLLLANDHLLKGAGLLPNWLTGKLSDVAGLFFFPILLTRLAQSCVHCATSQLSRPPPGARLHLALAALSVGLTAAVFTILKLSATACTLLAAVWCTIVCDPTDPLALPALVAAYVYIKRTAQYPKTDSVQLRQRWSERAWLCVAALASVATAPPHRPPFVAWQTEAEQTVQQRVAAEQSPRPATHQAGCARVHIWTAKSGKSGVGFSIARVVENAAGSACGAVLERATLQLGARQIALAAAPYGELSEQATYLPFLFDNEAAWNAGERVATLRLELRVRNEAVVLTLPLSHVWNWRDKHHDWPTEPQPISTRTIMNQGDAGRSASDVQQ